jgi:hypothetical protein
MEEPSKRSTVGAALCVECEDAPVALLCTQCGDAFCELCYGWTHQSACGVGGRRNSAAAKQASKQINPVTWGGG